MTKTLELDPDSDSGEGSPGLGPMGALAVALQKESRASGGGAGRRPRARAPHLNGAQASGFWPQWGEAARPPGLTVALCPPFQTPRRHLTQPQRLSQLPLKSDTSLMAASLPASSSSSSPTPS